MTAQAAADAAFLYGWHRLYERGEPAPQVRFTDPAHPLVGFWLTVRDSDIAKAEDAEDEVTVMFDVSWHNSQGKPTWMQFTVPLSEPMEVHP